jgi:hypothetical protein
VRDILAEKLLVRVMGWDKDQVKAEVPLVLALASYKYNEYQQFSPGMRFVESLARWLRQFETSEERTLAYEFVRDRLIFCSSTEMRHFVEMAYPDHIRPYLLRRAAQEIAQDWRHVGRVARSKEFRVIRRQCLYLGLSDGARIDLFRRSSQELDHEQIWQTYELADDRVKELLEKLGEDVAAMRGDVHEETKFTTVVLLDDFSASGRSYYMPRGDGTLGGKIAKFHQQVTNPESRISQLVDLKHLHLIILLYVATDQALAHLDECSAKLWNTVPVPCTVQVVQRLPDHLRLTADNSEELVKVIERYYDHDIHDSHMEKGGTSDSKYGFAACGLPLVLHHNTPNNAIALLWSYEDKKVRGLFPRIRRHKEVP